MRTRERPKSLPLRAATAGAQALVDLASAFRRAAQHLEDAACFVHMVSRRLTRRRSFYVGTPSWCWTPEERARNAEESAQFALRAQKQGDVVI